MKKILLLTTLLALAAVTMAQESRIYVCKGRSYHVYPTADVDSITFDKAGNPSQVYISKGTDRHTYDAAATDSFTFIKPAITAGKQATDRIYASETFATDFGAFTVRTVKGLPWVIAYSSAKASGYDNSTTTPSESYLLSEAYDMTEATGATLTFKYVLQYSGSATKVLITDQYTGDPATTVWTDITDGQISNTKDFYTFSTYTCKIPSRFLGESNVVIALCHSCGSSSSTWEVKNLQLSLDGTSPGGGGTDPTPSDDPANTNKNTKGLDKGAGRLEIPKLSDKDLQLFIVKQTSGIDRTYSLEWDCTKKANRWVALQMHDGLPDNGVGRNDGWQDDADIPSQYQTHDADYKGTPFSRGHMCASSDRQTTVAQNRQTFIMSN
ncbi:MAG: DNA/RNA non-specific endonuclease, partial [Prevotella sp.]|nr:DNA/RNA non-specific endonuclease [Prevotella sp.]